MGTNGVGSVVRRLLHPAQPPPRSSGIIAVREIAWDGIGHLGPLSGIYYLGPGVESLLARASDTRIYWALSPARELVPEETRDPAELLALMSPRFDGDFRAVTSATEEMRCDELVDREPFPFWEKAPSRCSAMRRIHYCHTLARVPPKASSTLSPWRAHWVGTQDSWTP